MSAYSCILLDFFNLEVRCTELQIRNLISGLFIPINCSLRKAGYYLLNIAHNFAVYIFEIVLP